MELMSIFNKCGDKKVLVATFVAMLFIILDTAGIDVLSTQNFCPLFIRCDVIYGRPQDRHKTTTTTYFV